jgi:hypothetical protein
VPPDVTKFGDTTRSIGRRPPDARRVVLAFEVQEHARTTKVFED